MAFTPSSPEKEEVTLFLPDANRGEGLEVTQFTEYSFHSNFLTPADQWSFTVASDVLQQTLGDSVVPGAPVKLKLNGAVQASGYIDSVEKSASRDGGSVWRIEGRDRLGQAVDACADPTVSLKESMTLLQGMKQLFEPFGWSEDDQFDESNEVDVLLKSGGHRRAKRKQSEGKGFGRKAIKAYKLHKYRPYPKESVYEFASRISQRFGLWIWSSSNGEKLIMSEPDFTSEPLYKLIRNANGTTNVLEGSVKYSASHQPTHIIADGYAGGGEFGKSRIKIIMENTAVRLGKPGGGFFGDINDDGAKFAIPELEKYLNSGAKVISGPSFPAANSLIAARPRVLYLHDDESQTIEHLENFVRREMALLQKGSLEVNYTVEGHGQITDEGFTPWTVDTVVEVDDEVAGLREKLYVLGRSFNKSRANGTTTHLDLIRLNTLVFSDTGK